MLLQEDWRLYRTTNVIQRLAARNPRFRRLLLREMQRTSADTVSQLRLDAGDLVFAAERIEALLNRGQMTSRDRTKALQMAVLGKKYVTRLINNLSPGFR